MDRSGCVSKRRRAGSPTIMLPSASRLTTDGQSVLPFGPGIHFGWPVCASTYATRLFVVPRSMPTMRPMVLPQFLLYVHNQIPNIGAAIQQVIELGLHCVTTVLARVFLNRLVPLPSCSL